MMKKSELNEESPRSKKDLSSFHLLAIVFLLTLTIVTYSPPLFFEQSSTSTTNARVSSPEAANIDESFLELDENESAERIEGYLKVLTAQPHVAGTPSDQEQAQFMVEQFKSFGWPDVQLQTYWPLLNYPASWPELAVIHPPEKRVTCDLREDVIDEDETSRTYRDTVPPFHGYSANGNITAPLVYANYGRLEDFEQLKRLGITLKGSIALVKYGRNFRGLKVRAAELYGCVGVIVYSDGKDDGAHKGETYPKGPWRPDSSLQRGSVHYMSLYPGDPLTPGMPSLQNATRLPQDKAITLPKIPSLPISFRDGQRLLKALEGEGLPASQLGKDWVGGSQSVTYWTGSGNVMVHLNNHVEFKVKPIWNVIATVKGSEEPDRVIILGNHRDAWVMGAVDPSSGTAILLELARLLGKHIQKGWRPKRTIMLASWDGEEYGMLGSTEFVEQFTQTLKETVVAYINVDSAVSGHHFRVEATPTLSQLIRSVSTRVKDPATQKSLHDAWLLQQRDWNATEDQVRPLVGQMGSGSDFVGFVDYLGVASVNLEFTGSYGVYHSNYDSFHWMTKFGDPKFEYHVTALKVWGLMSLGLSESPILPMNYTEYAVELRYYVSRLETRFGIKSFHDMREAISELETFSRQLQAKIELLLPLMNKLSGFPLRHMLHKLVRGLNDRLMMAERAFLDPKGIPGRTWYKHVVYAPGLWAGYGAATFPTLGEAIEQALADGGRSRPKVFQVEHELAARIRRVVAVLKGTDLGRI